MSKTTCVCIGCHKTFTPKQTVQFYCSYACRRRDVYKRDHEAGKKIRINIGVETFSIVQLQRARENEFIEMANKILNGKAVVSNTRGLDILLGLT